MKKKTSILAIVMAILMLASTMSVYADAVTLEEGDEPYLSLGADLTSAQEATVLGFFGLEQTDLENYDVHYVTNDEEYKYLGDYLDSSMIGSQALSSVLVKAGDSDDINITTYNINYCTEGMYRNALATAGVSGVDVIVAGPFELSGTAGLVGIIKAYENMTGEEISDDVIESAVEEITTTGEIGEEVGDMNGVEGIIASVKEQLADNPNMSIEDIKEAIISAADKAGISLSDESIQKLADMLSHLKDSNIDWGKLKEQSKSILKKFDGLFSDENKEKAMGFLSRFVEWIKGLIG